MDEDEDKKDKMIGFLGIVIIVLFFVLLHNMTPSIQKRAEILRDNEYKLDYDAIDEFSAAWDDYLEQNKERQYQDY